MDLPAKSFFKMILRVTFSIPGRLQGGSGWFERAVARQKARSRFWCIHKKAGATWRPLLMLRILTMNPMRRRGSSFAMT